jgi:hypothetical protein
MITPKLAKVPPPKSSYISSNAFQVSIFKVNGIAIFKIELGFLLKNLFI